MNAGAALDIRAPSATPIPLVFDSPHSGTEYPADFGFAAPFAALRTCEDTHVDALFGAAPEHGATLLAARFPRSYIDVNRALDDLDPELLAEPWPARLAPGEKTRLGIGLIRRFAKPDVPVYDRKLPVAEVRARIENYYLRYHDALARIIDDLHGRFGGVWHIDCHSMQSTGTSMTPDGARVRPDFVIGDRDGSTCSPVFTDLVVSALRGRGYHVTVNDPYKGAEIVRRYADPPTRRHCLQIEVNRKLYMDEVTRERDPGFEQLRADLSDLVALVANWVRAAIA
jgi:N-formylglutamate amidohydrolase